MAGETAALEVERLKGEVKVMAAQFETHRAETQLDIANLAKEFGKEMRYEIRAVREEAKRARDDDRAEAKKARDDDRAVRYADRAMARNGHLWTWGLIAAVGLAVLFGG